MSRKLTFTLIIIFMLSLIAYFYVNAFLLPIKFKQYTIEKSQEILGRKVNIAKIQFHPLKGFVVNEFKAYRKDDPTKLFAEIKQASFGVVFSSLFKDKTIFIPNLKIVEPFLYISKIGSKTWNFSDLLDKDNAGNKENKYTTIIKRISVQKGEISYADMSLKDELIESIKNINVLINISLDRIAEFAFSSYISSPDSKIKTSGSFDIVNRTLDSKIAITNIAPARHLKSYVKNSPVDIKNGMITDADIALRYEKGSFNISGNATIGSLDISAENINKLSGNIKAEDINLSLKDNKIDLSSKVSIADADIETSGNTALKGNIEINAEKLQHSKDNLAFKGNINIKNSSFTIGKNTYFSGNINASGVEFSDYNSSLNAGGDISIDNAILKMKDKRSFSSSSLSFTKAKIAYENEKLDLGGYISTRGSNIHIGDNISIQGDLSADNASISYYQKGLTLGSQIKIDNAMIKTPGIQEITGNINAKYASLFFKDKKLSIKSELELGNILAQTPDGKKISGDISVSSLDLVYDGKFLGITSSLSLNNAEISFNGIRYNGNPKAELTYEYNKDGHKKHYYKGSANITDSKLTGIPRINNAENIKGSFYFETDNISFNKIELNALNSKFNLSGRFYNFKKPSLDIKLFTDNIDLSLAQTLVPELTEKAGITEIKGNSSLGINFKGLLSDLKQATIDATSVLHNVSVKQKSIPAAINKLNGSISYSPDLLSWTNLNGSYDNKIYSTSGKLVNFARPKATYEVTSKDLSLKAQMNILRNVFQFESLTGKYFNSSFDITGDTYFEEKDTRLDLRGSFVLDIKNINNISPDLYTKLSSLKVGGIIYGADLLFKGYLRDWKNWNLTFKATSPSLSLLGYNFNNASIAFAQTDQTISQLNISSYLYDGKIDIMSSADLSNDLYPFKASIIIDNLDMEKFRKDKKIRMRDLQGKFFANINLSGPSKDPDKIEGLASFKTKDAYIGEMALVKGLLSVINNVPGKIGDMLNELSNQTTQSAVKSTTNYITDASGTFTIKDSKATTHDLVLKGSLYDLKILGYINKQLVVDAIAYPDHSRFLNKENRIATNFIGSPIQVHITGPIKHPSFKPSFNPVKPIENAVGTTFDVLKEVGGIFGNLLGN